MGNCSDGFSKSNVEGSVLEWSFVVFDRMLSDDAARGGISVPGSFSLRIMVPSDGGMEQPIPKSVYGLLHLFLIA